MGMSEAGARISAVLITRDEAADLPDCLASLAFCDEIVVVDGGSTDATVAIGNVGANGRVDSHTVQQPIASFVLTNVGLEAGVSVGGSRIVPIALP